MLHLTRKFCNIVNPHKSVILNSCKNKESFLASGISLFFRYWVYQYDTRISLEMTAFIGCPPKTKRLTMCLVPSVCNYHEGAFY